MNSYRLPGHGDGLTFDVLVGLGLDGAALRPLHNRPLYPQPKHSSLQRTLDSHVQCCGSGSKLDPYSRTLWIQICIPNPDPDPYW